MGRLGRSLGFGWTWHVDWLGSDRHVGWRRGGDGSARHLAGPARKDEAWCGLSNGRDGGGVSIGWARTDMARRVEWFGLVGPGLSMGSGRLVVTGPGRSLGNGELLELDHVEPSEALATVGTEAVLLEEHQRCLELLSADVAFLL